MSDNKKSTASTAAQGEPPKKRMRGADEADEEEDTGSRESGGSGGSGGSMKTKPARALAAVMAEVEALKDEGEEASPALLMRLKDAIAACRGALWYVNIVQTGRTSTRVLGTYGVYTSFKLFSGLIESGSGPTMRDGELVHVAAGPVGSDMHDCDIAADLVRKPETFNRGLDDTIECAVDEFPRYIPADVLLGSEEAKWATLAGIADGSLQVIDAGSVGAVTSGNGGGGGGFVEPASPRPSTQQ